jgi:hypothetical protein
MRELTKRKRLRRRQAQGEPWAEWREDKQNLERSLAPERLQDSAQGFNPGNHPIKRIALKGREMIAWSRRVLTVFGLAPFQGAVRFGPVPGVETLG